MDNDYPVCDTLDNPPCCANGPPTWDDWARVQSKEGKWFPRTCRKYSDKFDIPWKDIIVTGNVSLGGEKMSKSLGNVIDPNELVKKYGADALRYYLLREISSQEDGDFSKDRFEERYRADLANGLGNFASRVSALAEEIGDLKSTDVNKEVEAEIENARKNIEESVSQFRIHEAVAAAWNLIHFGDGYVDEKKPWENKDKQIIFDLVVLLDNIASLVAPVVPDAAEKITNAIQWGPKDTLKVKKIEALYPRLE